MAERDFIDVLGDLNDGATVAEMTTLMQSLVASVVESGRAGAITITLKLKPSGKSNQITIEDAIKVTEPKRATGTTVLFHTDSHELVRKDPRQPELSGLRRPADVMKITREGS